MLTGKRNENIFIEKDDYIIGIDTKGREFYFDKEDLQKVKEYYWFISSEGYVITCRNRRTIMLHRYLLDNINDKEVDHINHEKNDCRRTNLRICLHKQNGCNRKAQRNNNCGYKGVGFHKGKYRARIRVNGILIDLGRFDTVEAAHEAYCCASKLYHGEYGCAG